MIKNSFLALVVLFYVSLGLLVFQTSVYAVPCTINGETTEVDSNEACTEQGGAVDSSGASPLNHVPFDSDGPKGTIGNGTINLRDRSSDAGQLYGRFINYVNIASIGVGVVSAIGVTIAGLQYATAQGEPGKTAAAVKRLTQVGTAIFLYIFGWVILNWLIPGGVLNDAEIIPELGWILRLS